MESVPATSPGIDPGADMTDMISTLLQRPVAYQPVFRHVGGSTVAGIMLSQLYYWSSEGRIGAERDGWFYKTQEEWHRETGLSRSEQERARRDLRKAKLLIEKRRGNPAKLWFRLDVAAVNNAVFQYAESCTLDEKTNENSSMQIPANKSAESCNQECSNEQSSMQNPANKNAESCNLNKQRVLTENTSETTTEISDSVDTAPATDGLVTASATAQCGTIAVEPDVEVYRSKKGKQLKGKILDRFNEFWDAFDYKKGKAEAADAFLKIQWTSSSIDNRTLFDQILLGAKLEAAQRPAKIAAKQTPIYAEGWISSRRWEDEQADLAANAVVAGVKSNRSEVTASVMNVHDTNW